MKDKNHIAFYVADKVNKKELIDQILNKKLLQKFIVIENLKTAVFSKSTLEAFIDDELKHGHFEIKTTNKIFFIY